MIRYLFIVLLFFGCGGEDETSPLQENNNISVSDVFINTDFQADTALLLFFEVKSSYTDTFSFYQEIYNVDMNQSSVITSVPIGYYRVVCIGNAISSFVVFPSVNATSSSVWLSAPPLNVLYYAFYYISVGDTFMNRMRVKPITVLVNADFDSIPTSVRYLAVRMTNTASGFYMNGNYVNKAVTVGDTVRVTDENMNVYLSAFPSIGKSKLEIEAFNISKQTLYRGTSSSFSVSYGQKINVTCDFNEDEEESIIGYEYEEYNMGDSVLSVTLRSL